MKQISTLLALALLVIFCNADPAPSSTAASGPPGCPCDPLTKCTEQKPGTYTCGPCPAGYKGDGIHGCSALPICQRIPNGGCPPSRVCLQNALDVEDKDCGCPQGTIEQGTSCTPETEVMKQILESLKRDQRVRASDYLQPFTFLEKAIKMNDDLQAEIDLLKEQVKTHEQSGQDVALIQSSNPRLTNYHNNVNGLVKEIANRATQLVNVQVFLEANSEEAINRAVEQVFANSADINNSFFAGDVNKATGPAAADADPKPPPGVMIPSIAPPNPAPAMPSLITKDSISAMQNPPAPGAPSPASAPIAPAASPSASSSSPAPTNAGSDANQPTDIEKTITTLRIQIDDAMKDLSNTQGSQLSDFTLKVDKLSNVLKLCGSLRKAMNEYKIQLIQKMHDYPTLSGEKIAANARAMVHSILTTLKNANSAGTAAAPLAASASSAATITIPLGGSSEAAPAPVPGAK